MSRQGVINSRRLKINVSVAFKQIIVPSVNIKIKPDPFKNLENQRLFECLLLKTASPADGVKIRTEAGIQVEMVQKIECPKCGFKQDGGTECMKCGVIFSRIRQSDVAPPHEPPIHSPSRPGKSLWARFGRFYRVFRWASLIMVLTVAGLILRDSPPPDVKSTPFAVQQAGSKVREFQSTIQQGRKGTLKMGESELNGWLNASLDIHDPIDSAPSYSQKQEPESQSINMEFEEYGIDEDTVEKAKSSIRDIRVELLNDTLLLYAVFDTHGVDLSLEFEGRVLVKDGCLRLAPLRGRLGSLPLPSGILQSAMDKLFESPENREKFRLPPYIRDMKIDGGQLVVSSR
jgi:hypothetical protein